MQQKKGKNVYGKHLQRKTYTTNDEYEENTHLLREKFRSWSNIGVGQTSDHFVTNLFGSW